MVLEKLDSIICNALISQGLPVHFYLKFLNFSINCLRELNMDIIGNPITVKLKLNSYGAANLPCNFLDWIRVGVPVGQYVKPISQKDSISRLKNIDENGVPIPYPMVNDIYPYLTEDYLILVNRQGEVMGGVFGWGNGSGRFGFKIIKERNQIQVDSNFPCKYVEIEYISDGLDDCGCDTMVDLYAYDTIRTYVIWQYYLNNKKLMAAAPQWERQFSNAIRILRGRKNNISVADILSVLRKNYKAVIKN